MGKFSISFKIKELELHVSGDRDDVQKLTAGARHQLGGLMQPAEGIVNGDDPINVTPNAAAEAVRGPKRKRTSSSNDGIEPLNFLHDAAKYGNPLSSWSVMDRYVWLLFVLKDSGVVSEISSRQLALTFNHHFKANGAVHVSNATRDLSRAKSQNPALAGEDKAKTPSTWYITAEGEKSAQRLIQSVLKAA